MSIFDIFRTKKSIPEPWKKYYTEKELDIHIPNISMYEQIKISKYKYPKYKAIEYQGKIINYTEFLKSIDEYAICFKKYGIDKGDIVSICLPNIPESLIALYALNKIGAIANMVHPLSSEEELVHAVESTKSRLLIFMDMFFPKIENTMKNTCVEKVIICNATDSLNPIMKLGYYLTQGRKFKKIPKDNFYIRWNKFKKTYYDNMMRLTKRFGKDTPAVIIHSGGTSGTPKNVVIQNRAFILGSKQEIAILKQLHPGDCCLAIMPNFHGFGLSVCMHTPLSLGGYTVLVPQFDAKKFDILFHKTKPTCVLGVPTLFEALSKNNNIKNLDLSFLKYAISGGDILPKNLEDRINDYFKDHNSTARITQGYGLSEALAAVTLCHDNIVKSGSIGIPMPGNHIKIIDPATRKTLKPGKVGEIVIHSKALMMGYLNDEAETNACIQIHDDGHIWLHTGDLGTMDKDGFVFYKGREKRMIITSGYNVYPSHVEEVIESHPAVLQCTVVGVPHPYKQQVGKAFVVLKEGKNSLFIKSELADYCKKKLSKYMIPAEFVIRKQLPKTKLGKVDFSKLQSDIGSDDE